MARRRYISTDISTDKAIRDLAVNCGDFAALLYTWMVPHADDQGLITSDPEELLWTVMSSFRHKAVEEVRTALDGMLMLGLIEVYDARHFAFPHEAFYRYQTYIPESKRRSPNSPNNEEPTPENADDQRPTPTNADKQRQVPENPAYPSPSPSPSPSVSPSPDGESAPDGDAPTSPPQDIEPFEMTMAERQIAERIKAIRGMAKVSEFAVIGHLREITQDRGSPISEHALLLDSGRFRDHYIAKRQSQPKDRAWSTWKKSMSSWFGQTREIDDGPLRQHTNGTASHTGSAPRPLYDDPKVKPVEQAYIRRAQRPARASPD